MTDKPNVPNQPAPARSGAPSPEEPRLRYTPQLAEEIELRWQDRWAERGTFWAANPSGPLTDGKGRHADPGSPSFFVMDMFPYPSGAGLHVGHPLGYIATDVVGRFRRMCGDNVLHALAFDAFGLPAEQYAVQTGQHPRITTEQNIANMQRQLRRLGLAHDERRSFATTDSEYVRWTQWIFLQIFNSWYDETAVRPDGGTGKARPIAELEAELADGTRPTPDGTPWAEMDAVARRRVIDSYRLAYVSESPVNWCPGLGTVLANEEVTADGRSERGNFPVFQRSLRQWNMRITAYADRLADDLELIDWPDKVKAMQRNWIGRSQGAKVRFDVQGGSEVEVFTTRPDTLSRDLHGRRRAAARGREGPAARATALPGTLPRRSPRRQPADSLERGCSGRRPEVAPNRVSGRVVKTSTSLPPWTSNRTLAPCERPIQLRCIALTLSGQSMSSRSSARRSAYAVMRMFHWRRLRWKTGKLPRSDRPSAVTSSFARTVPSPGHQFTGDSET
ncbi:leucyl-tRNA synthetase-like protein [Flavimobilis soli]|uniref:leucine--tRNA ligase n=1 Tax=Flavimobilis soli TaxID=442709 RepID=A0A2A9EHW1_9MICO|nr:leucyl-tRNA synthetase-like protein [Flavimobilis soli]